MSKLTVLSGEIRELLDGVSEQVVHDVMNKVQLVYFEGHAGGKNMLRAQYKDNIKANITAANSIEDVSMKMLEL